MCWSLWNDNDRFGISHTESLRWVRADDPWMLRRRRDPGVGVNAVRLPSGPGLLRFSRAVFRAEAVLNVDLAVRRALRSCRLQLHFQDQRQQAGRHGPRQSHPGYLSCCAGIVHYFVGLGCRESVPKSAAGASRYVSIEPADAADTADATIIAVPTSPSSYLQRPLPGSQCARAASSALSVSSSPATAQPACRCQFQPRAPAAAPVFVQVRLLQQLLLQRHAAFRRRAIRSGENAREREELRQKDVIKFLFFIVGERRRARP